MRIVGAIISGLMAPHSPAKERWETIWHYMQSGPGVLHGDTAFYKGSGTLEPEQRERLLAGVPVEGQTAAFKIGRAHV